MKETWKPVVGYEETYLVSNLGNVKSVGNFIMPNGGNRPIRELKKGVHRCGYLIVRLYKNGKQKQHYIHRLVAMAFIENPFDKEQVNHIDGDKTNNAVDNLEWVSREENINHAYETELNEQSNRIVLIDKATKERKTFSSFAKASAYMGKNIAYISEMLKLGKCQNKRYLWEVENG